MRFKSSTREKFHEITLEEESVSANMTADLQTLLTDCQQVPPRNIILNLEQVQQMDEAIARTLTLSQGASYEASHSFVVCCLQKTVEEALDKLEVLELLNVTPTLSEAWDIVQMEEIERELLDGFED